MYRFSKIPSRIFLINFIYINLDTKTFVLGTLTNVAIVLVSYPLWIFPIVHISAILILNFDNSKPVHIRFKV